jgi:hypothetical protein
MTNRPTPQTWLLGGAHGKIYSRKKIRAIIHCRIFGGCDLKIPVRRGREFSAKFAQLLRNCCATKRIGSRPVSCAKGRCLTGILRISTTHRAVCRRAFSTDSEILAYLLCNDRLRAWLMISPTSTFKTSPIRSRVSRVGFHGFVSILLINDWLNPVF